MKRLQGHSLCEKCPNTEFFLVRIFLHLVRIQENTDQKNPVFGHFPRSDLRGILIKNKSIIQKLNQYIKTA